MLNTAFSFEQTPEGTVVVTGTANLRAKLDTIFYTVQYTVSEAGSIAIKVNFDLSEVKAIFPALPRIGVQLLLPEQFAGFSWYGKGPHENYSDRQNSAMVGVYHSSVQEQHFNYLRPQETGNRCDVRWSDLKSTSGATWRAEAESTFSTSVSPYSQTNLTAAAHVNELTPAGYTTWNIDVAQFGVGGDVSWVPSTHPQFWLKEKQYSLNFTLIPS